MTRRRQLRRQFEENVFPNEMQPKIISVRHPQVIAGALAVALAFDASGVVRIGLLCATLHECGHVALYRVFVGEWPLIVLAPGEVRMKVPYDRFTPGRELLVAGAGVAANLLGCLGTLVLMDCCFGYSYWGYWFAANNMLLAGLNLLPVRALDGGRMIDCIRQMKGT